MVKPVVPPISPIYPIQQRRRMEEQQWKMIRTAALHDPILQDLLDKAIIYWKLKYDHDYERTDQGN
jgi:hypothetical protein